MVVLGRGAVSAARLRVGWLSGRGTARAEDAQGTPTQSHISPSILVYEEYTPFPKHLYTSSPQPSPAAPAQTSSSLLLPSLELSDTIVYEPQIRSLPKPCREDPTPRRAGEGAEAVLGADPVLDLGPEAAAPPPRRRERSPRSHGGRQGIFLFIYIYIL